MIDKGRGVLYPVASGWAKSVNPADKITARAIDKFHRFFH
jgi:hypothetical protein